MFEFYTRDVVERNDHDCGDVANDRRCDQALILKYTCDVVKIIDADCDSIASS